MKIKYICKECGTTYSAAKSPDAPIEAEKVEMSWCSQCSDTNMFNEYSENYLDKEGNILK